MVRGAGTPRGDRHRGDSGNPVTFTIDHATTPAPSPAPPSPSATPAPASIDADQAGNDDYNAADAVTQTLRRGQGRPARSPSPRPPTSPWFGDTDTLAVTAQGDSGNPVTFSSTTTGRLHPRRHHRHRPPRRHLRPSQATQAGNDDYNAADAVTQTLHGGQGRPAGRLHLDLRPARGPRHRHARGDRPRRLRQPGHLLSTTPDACTLDGSTVTVHHAGTCTIAADQAGNDDYLAAPTVTRTVTIRKATQSITFTSAHRTCPRRHLRPRGHRRRLRQPGHLLVRPHPTSAASPGPPSPSATPAPASSPPTRPATTTTSPPPPVTQAVTVRQGHADDHVHLEGARVAHTSATPTP